MKNYKLQPFLMEKPRTCASRLVHQDESTSSTIRVATRIVGYGWERGKSPLPERCRLCRHALIIYIVMFILVTVVLRHPLPAI